ncbi:hypothetical protein NYO98_13590 [Nocardioides sp. STR2]|uniref:YcxB-like protein n=1 Tax=Nocardioides pini TaxID=2975053 RepID=A0ABT4CEB1_9ACTN|nr:hypothetical protein [Nocardioides pini]MCY4727315.1 hypothetical protein [Nocardioides pini]
MDDTLTYRWVAGPDSARAAARSFSRGTLRRRRPRAVLVGLWLLTGLFMWTSLDADLGPVARILWALAYAAALDACAFGIGTLLGRHLTRRRLATRLGPGTELTSRFGPGTVELAGPLSRHELSYDGLTHVDRVDGWVHLHQLGSPVALVWPGELFPDEELDRMRRRIAERRT